VSAKRASQVRLRLTYRAANDLRDIERYSIEKWGKRTADEYLADMEAALQRLVENPELLREEPDFHSSLKFYRVNKHWLVCDVQADVILVLAVAHASMDVRNRLAELQPTLASEAEMLHAKLHRQTRRNS
jgi:toxin ParE1/3/4